MQWGRAAPVPQLWIGSYLDQSFDRVRAAGSNGAMQRGDAAVIGRVGIGSCLDEIGDHVVLGIRVPVLGTGASVCRVVDRFGASSVPSAHICPPCNDGFR